MVYTHPVVLCGKVYLTVLGKLDFVRIIYNRNCLYQNIPGVIGMFPITSGYILDIQSGANAAEHGNNSIKQCVVALKLILGNRKLTDLVGYDKHPIKNRLYQTRKDFVCFSRYNLVVIPFFRGNDVLGQKTTPGVTFQFHLFLTSCGFDAPDLSAEFAVFVRIPVSRFRNHIQWPGSRTDRQNKIVGVSNVNVQ